MARPKTLKIARKANLMQRKTRKKSTRRMKNKSMRRASGY